jgi:hypothetical protein
MRMARYFVFTYVDEKITAKAVLLDKEAPKTVEMLWRHAPFDGLAVHAIYSGTTVGLLFDPTIVVPMENATTHLQTRDLLFTHYDAQTRYGHPDAVSEVYWAYDRFCRPVMPGAGLPVCPNVFGHFLDGCEEFFAASRRVAAEGAKRLTIAQHAD